MQEFEAKLHALILVLTFEIYNPISVTILYGFRWLPFIYIFHTVILIKYFILD